MKYPWFHALPPIIGSVIAMVALITVLANVA